MYHHKQFGNIVVAVFNEAVTITDVEAFVDHVDTITDTLDEIYILSLPIGATDIPKNVAQLVKTLSRLKSSLGKIQRLYHIQINPIVSFIGTTVAQVMRLKSRTIEAKNLDDLYRIMQVEGEQFPALKASLVHLDEMKAFIASFERVGEVE